MGAGPSSGRRTRVADASNQAPVQLGQGSNFNASRSASVQSGRNPSSSNRFRTNTASSPPSNASAKSLPGDSTRGRLPVVSLTSQHAHNVQQTRRDEGALTQQRSPSPIDEQAELPHQSDDPHQDSVSSYSSGPSIDTLEALFPVDKDQILSWSLADTATAPRSHYTASKSTSGIPAAAKVTAPLRSESVSITKQAALGNPAPAVFSHAKPSHFIPQPELSAALAPAATPERSCLEAPVLLHTPPTPFTSPTPSLQPLPTQAPPHPAGQVPSEQQLSSFHEGAHDDAVVRDRIGKLQGAKRHKGSSALQGDENMSAQPSSSRHSDDPLEPWLSKPHQPHSQPPRKTEPETSSGPPTLNIPPRASEEQEQANLFLHTSEPDSTAFLDTYNSPVHDRISPVSSLASGVSVDRQDGDLLHPSPGNQQWQADDEEPAQHQRIQPSSFSVFLPQALQEACIEDLQASIATEDGALNREACSQDLQAATAVDGALQKADALGGLDNGGTHHTDQVLSLFSSGGGLQASEPPTLDWFHAAVPSRSNSYLQNVGSEMQQSSTGGSADAYLFSAQQSQALSEEEASLSQQGSLVQLSQVQAQQEEQHVQQEQDTQQPQQQQQQKVQHTLQQEQTLQHKQQEQQARPQLQTEQESQAPLQTSPSYLLSHPSETTQDLTPESITTSPTAQPAPDEAAQRALSSPFDVAPAVSPAHLLDMTQLVGAGKQVLQQTLPQGRRITSEVIDSKHDSDMTLVLQAATVAAMHQSSIVQQQLQHLQQQQQEILSHVQQAAQQSPAKQVRPHPGSTRAVREVVDAVTALAASLTPPSRLRRARHLRPDPLHSSSSPSSDVHTTHGHGSNVDAHESCKKCGQSILLGTGAKRRHDSVDPRSSRPPVRRRSSGIESDFLRPITLDYSDGPPLCMVSTGTQTKTPPQDKGNQTEPQPDQLNQQQQTHHTFIRGLSLIPETSPASSSKSPGFNNGNTCTARPADPTTYYMLDSEGSGITGPPASIPPQATFLQRLAGVASQRTHGRSVSSLDDGLSQHTLRTQHTGIPGHRNVPESHASGEDADEGKAYASVPAWVANTAATIPYAGAAALYRPHTTNSSAPPSTQGALLQGLSIEALHRERLRRRQLQDQADIPGMIAGLPTMMQAHSKRHFLSPSKAYGATADLDAGQAPKQAAYTGHLETPSTGLQSYSQSILGSWNQRRGPDQYPTSRLHSRNPTSWGVPAADNLSRARVNVEPGMGYTPFKNSSPGFTEPAAKRLRSDWPSTAAYNNQASAFSDGAPDPPGMFVHQQQGREALQSPPQMHGENTDQQQQQSYLSHVRSRVASNHQLQHIAPPSTTTAGVIGMSFGQTHGQGFQGHTGFAAIPQHLLPPSLMKAAGTHLGQEQGREVGARDSMFGADSRHQQTTFPPALQPSQVHHQQWAPNQQDLRQQQYTEQQQGHQQHYYEQQQQQQPLQQQFEQEQHHQQQQQQQVEDLRLLQLLSQNTLLQLQQQPLDPQVDELLQLLRTGDMWGAQSMPTQPGPDPALVQCSTWQPPPSEASEMLNRYLHE